MDSSSKETITHGSPVPSMVPLWFKLTILFIFTVGVLGAIKYFIIHPEGVTPIEFWMIPVISGGLVVLVWGLFEVAANKAEKIKYDFLTVASHRLRTPLTRATWSVDGLALTADTEEERELIDNIKSTITEMSEIANHLLAATESRSGSLYYDYIFEKGSVGALARQVVASYMPGITKKNIALSVEVSAGVPQVILDPERLRIALGSILENAIIYTPVGGKITILVYAEGNNVICSVEDTGIGIPKEAQPFLFSQFFRTKEAIGVDPNRAGLGLAIAREIIFKHNGKLFASSAGKDRGSKFWFVLPAAQ